MPRRALPLFLVALLLSAMADDLFASLTADPHDDVLAAADNTYLCARPAHDQLRHQGNPLPSPRGLFQSAIALPAAPPRPGRPAGTPLAPRSGTDLLYALQSLQR